MNVIAVSTSHTLDWPRNQLCPAYPEVGVLHQVFTGGQLHGQINTLMFINHPFLSSGVDK